MIIIAARDLGKILQNMNRYQEASFHKTQQELVELFWEDNEEITKDNEKHLTKFLPDLIIFMI